jgi:hypothetical protein
MSAKSNQFDNISADLQTLFSTPSLMMGEAPKVNKYFDYLPTEAAAVDRQASGATPAAAG